MNKMPHYGRKCFLTGVMMIGGLLTFPTLAATSTCGLGQKDCDLPAAKQVDIPVATKWGLEYKCSIQSAEGGHKINGTVEGTNGFVYGPQSFIASTKGYDTVLQGSFAEGKTDGFITIKNFSLYDGKVSCSRTGAK